MKTTLRSGLERLSHDSLLTSFTEFLEIDYRKHVFSIFVRGKESTGISIFWRDSILEYIYHNHHEDLLTLFPSLILDTVWDVINFSLSYSDYTIYLLVQELLLNNIIEQNEVPQILYALQYWWAASYKSRDNINTHTENTDHKISIAIYDAIKNGNDYWIAIKKSIDGIDSIRIWNLYEITRLLNTWTVVVTRKIPISEKGFQDNSWPYLQRVKNIQESRNDIVHEIKNIEEVSGIIRNLPWTITLTCSKNRYIIDIISTVDEDIKVLDDYKKQFPEAKIKIYQKWNRKRFTLEEHISLRNK